MAPSEDHFQTFLRRIGADRGTQTDPDLARVARALAGEQPARFHARLLLERAAHRMVATTDTLRDIVADSGFPSAEVFNRAFRREHGVLPSAWRADPTTHLLEAPNDVHFRPPAGLRLPPRHRMDGVDLVVEMAEHHVLLLGELVALAALVPDDALDAPSGGCGVPRTVPRTVRALLAGLVTELEELGALVHGAGDDAVAEKHPSVPSLRRRLDVAGPAFVADVSHLATTGRLDETFVDASTATPRVRSFGAMVREVLVDSGHRRLVALSRLTEVSS